MHFAVCDDQRFYVEQISWLIRQYADERGLSCYVDEFVSPEELLKKCETTRYDAVFLDVEMAERSGLETAEQIRLQCSDVYVILVSNHLDYALEGYRVDAFRYLLKEQLEQKFTACMNALKAALFPPDNSLVLRIEREEIRLNLDQVQYFEAAQHTVKAYFAAKDRPPMTFRITMTELEQKLAQKDFLRIQRSFIVNLKQVKRFYNYTVVLKSGKVISVSEKQFSALRDQFLTWKGTQE